MDDYNYVSNYLTNIITKLKSYLEAISYNLHFAEPDDNKLGIRHTSRGSIRIFFYVQRLMRYQTEDGRSQLGKQPGQQLCVRILWTFSHIPLSYSTSLLSREIYSFPIFDFFPRLTRSWNIERYPAFQYSQRRDVFVEFLSRSHLEPYELLLSRNGDVDWCWETDS